MLVVAVGFPVQLTEVHPHTEVKKELEVRVIDFAVQFHIGVISERGLEGLTGQLDTAKKTHIHRAVLIGAAKDVIQHISPHPISV